MTRYIAISIGLALALGACEEEDDGGSDEGADTSAGESAGSASAGETAAEGEGGGGPYDQCAQDSDCPGGATCASSSQTCQIDCTMASDCPPPPSGTVTCEA